MDTLVIVLLVAYLVIGALISFSVTALDLGLNGRVFGIKELIFSIAVLFLWFPYIIWKLLKYCAMIILPMPITNRLFKIKIG